MNRGNVWNVARKLNLAQLLRFIKVLLQLLPYIDKTTFLALSAGVSVQTD